MTAESTAQGKSAKTLSEVLRSLLKSVAIITILLLVVPVWYGVYDLSSANGIFELVAGAAMAYGFILFVAFYVKTLWHFFRGEIAQDDVSQVLPRRPRGLTVLAVFNFVFVAIFLFTLWGILFSPQASLGDMTGTSFLAAMMIVFEIGILTVSGIGFLRVSFRWGYVAGLVYAVMAIASTLITTFMGGLELALLIFPLVYPMLLALLLVVKYRPYFSVQSNESAA